MSLYTLDILTFKYSLETEKSVTGFSTETWNGVAIENVIQATL